MSADGGRQIMPGPLRPSHAEIPAPPPELVGLDLVLYDGECGLCDRAVRFLLARDRRDRLRFASLQSGWARWALARRADGAGAPPMREARPAAREDSMHVVAELGTQRERLLLRSAAALHLCRVLGSPWSLLGIFRLVPPPLRDLLYRFVARNRRRWFAAPTCPIGAARPAGHARKLLVDPAPGTELPPIEPRRPARSLPL
jgi:predicted DCC family thiol-disulfide oxidoreductase YuxK